MARASEQPPAPASAERASPWRTWHLALLLVCGVCAAYANSLGAPFIFDDLAAIPDNPSIRHLWPLWNAWWAPPSATGAFARPLINLSLALNYALGGLNPVGYHLFNLGVHALAALTLFGLVRRTLQGPVLRKRFGARALPLAFATALLWALHPLLTESVTFVIQRTESLSGLFYLLALYALARGRGAEGARSWSVISVAACLAGVATKETTVTLPVIALLYDRTFWSGDFRKAWRSHWRYYCALALTWVPLGLLVAAGNERAGVVGFGLGTSAWHYALTQCRAILLYLKLAVWPRPLVVDYGAGVVGGLSAVWWQAVVLLALAAGTFWALARRPVLGFMGFAFFGLLAPSSSFVPLTTQTMAEHRMYLPLAVVVALVVTAAHRRWPRWTVPVVCGLAVLAALGTALRNDDYRTSLGLWQQTVADAPGNARAHVNYGGFLAKAGRVDEAVTQFQTALRLKPDFYEALFSMGNALSQRGDDAASLPYYRQAVRVEPASAPAHYWLAYALMHTGRTEEALKQCALAYQLAPDRPDTLHTYAGLLGYVGQLDKSLDIYRQALRVSPGDPALHYETGVLLERMGRLAEAEQELRAAVRLSPGSAPLHNALGEALLQRGGLPAAKAEFETALRLQPGFAPARDNLDRLRREQILRDLQ